MFRPLAIVVLAALAAACSSHHTSSCAPGSQSSCGSGQVCEGVQGGAPACFDPVVIEGVVFDLAYDTTTGGLADARVVALDVNGAPMGAAATSSTSGVYSLSVPATRSTSGAPSSSAAVTLRADRAGYFTFPSGIRVAVPLDLSLAVHEGSTWKLSSSLTDIGLIAAPGAGTARIHGNVAGARGVLVVAEPAGGGAGHTAVADSTGSYVIFNLAAGDWTVKAYGRGANFTTGAATGLAAGEDRAVDLSIASTATATVTGSLQPTGQNQPQSLDTSVILVVRSTYQPAIDRGEAPPGLIAPHLTTSNFSISGVPDGEYTVLAAFGNDGYVRDISGIGGTAPVDVVVAGGTMTSAPGSFKITGAVSFDPTNAITASSGTEGAVTIVTSATPTFNWVAYPSLGQGNYQVDVFNALGEDVWAPAAFDHATTSASYGGPSLTAGMTYQVRVTAFDTNANQISRTEDLLGIFTYRP